MIQKELKFLCTNELLSLNAVWGGFASCVFALFPEGRCLHDACLILTASRRRQRATEVCARTFSDVWMCYSE